MRDKANIKTTYSKDKDEINKRLTQDKAILTSRKPLKNNNTGVAQTVDKETHKQKTYEEENLLWVNHKERQAEWKENYLRERGENNPSSDEENTS